MTGLMFPYFNQYNFNSALLIFNYIQRQVNIRLLSIEVYAKLIPFALDRERRSQCYGWRHLSSIRIALKRCVFAANNSSSHLLRLVLSTRWHDTTCALAFWFRFDKAGFYFYRKLSLHIFQRVPSHSPVYCVLNWIVIFTWFRSSSITTSYLEICSVVVYSLYLFGVVWILIDLIRYEIYLVQNLIFAGTVFCSCYVIIMNYIVKYILLYSIAALLAEAFAYFVDFYMTWQRRYLQKGLIFWWKKVLW